MESRVFLSFLIALLLSTAAAAETYRWKDKQGELHFGSIVPTEYSDQPYDVINEYGLVVGRVEPGSQGPEALAEAARQRAIDIKVQADRQAQSDRLLLTKYPTEDALLLALRLELDQVGYDQLLINQSFENTNAAIIDKVRLAADQQRAGIAVSEAQVEDFNKLYRNLTIDRQKLSSTSGRRSEVKEQFAAELLRYRGLVEKYNNPDKEEAPEQDSSTDAEPKDQS